MKKLEADKSIHLKELDTVVESINVFQNNCEDKEQHLLFDALPEGVFEMVFQANRSVWQKNGKDKTWAQREKSFVGGLHQHNFQIKLQPNTELISVRFKPGAFKYIYSGRVNDFTNDKVSISEIWNSEGKKLENMLNKQNLISEKIQLIARFIESKMDLGKQSKIDELVHLIKNRNGMVNIDSLESDSCLSSAQFRKKFREEVGLSPKKYLKIIKINSIINDFKQQPQKKLLDLAFDYNYFDQSHFIKDFKSIVGKTPSQYFLQN